MKGWPFAEAARKPIDLDDYLHQRARRMYREIDDRVEHAIYYGEGTNKEE
jgi:hypothetical protein